MKHDRFLLGILVFIALLVAAALTLFFTRQDMQTYGAEDMPEGVIRNYVLALQNRDFERAYGYLADKDNKPTLDAFRQAFLNRQLDISNAAIQIGSVEMIGSDQAMVEVTIVYASSDPFSTGWSSNETALLVEQDGAWRISSMPYPYWGWDWYQPTAAPVKP
ncbi:hypothetical protein GW866_06340 [bacterium]|nr:hypothetical protein [bacterium]